MHNLLFFYEIISIAFVKTLLYLSGTIQNDNTISLGEICISKE